MRGRLALLVMGAVAALHGQAPAVPTGKGAPTAKQVVQWALQSQAVPLSVDRSCHGVGTDPSDQTIGAYLSGFLAEQTGPPGANWVETACKPAKAGQGWECTLTLRRQRGEDEWGWGVRFRVANGQVDRSSFRCVGSG